jgi:3-hydroxybutyryl-CoA dehydrogenase
MQVVVLANKWQKEELGKGPESVVWINDPKDFSSFASTDVFVDLLFQNTPERISLLKGLLPKTVIISSVIDTLSETDPAFIRMNGWPTFLSSPVVEAAGQNKRGKEVAAAVFSLFAKTIQWLPDEPGFVTARVVSMIINEAYLALEEGVSTKEEINTAMKLGTAYPFGPFEWGGKIGLHNCVALLQKLAAEKPHYTPSTRMVQERGGAS